MAAEALWKQCVKGLQLVASLGTLAFAALTLHDMQTAEGTGLYLAICAGTESRRLFYDLAVDAGGMLCLLALAAAPCIVWRRLHPGAFLRILAACLAFLPTVSTASLVHLADGTDKIMLREAILEGNLGEALMEGLAGWMPILVLGVPILILAAAAQAERPAAGEGRIPAPGRRALSALLMSLMVLALLFPILAAHCMFVAAYLLLLRGLAAGERLCDSYPKWNLWGGVLYGIFWLRGIGRMMEVMSIYHL